MDIYCLVLLFLSLSPLQVLNSQAVYYKRQMKAFRVGSELFFSFLLKHNAKELFFRGFGGCNLVSST